jgi:hypothetical protein
LADGAGRVDCDPTEATGATSDGHVAHVAKSSHVDYDGRIPLARDRGGIFGLVSPEEVMSWKTIAVLGILSVGVMAAIVTVQPHTIDPEQVQADYLPGWSVAEIDTVTISSPGQVEVILKRTTQPGSTTWNLIQPRAWSANSFMVEDMIRALFGTRKSPFLKPGHKEYTPEKYGLQEPRLTVSFRSGEKGIHIRFGLESKVYEKQVWIQIDNDPNIYFSSTEVVQSFQRDIHQLRSKQIASFEHHRVTRILLSEWEQGGDINTGEKWKRYNASEMVLRPTEPKGWFLRDLEERLDDRVVLSLLSVLRGIVADDFVPMTDLKKFGLEEAWLKISVESTADAPWRVRFGLEGKGKMYVWVEGSDEIAIVDKAKYIDPLPKTRNTFRSRKIIPWTEEQTKRIEVEAAGLGKISLVPEKRKTSTDNMVVESIVWKPTETGGLEYEEEQASAFAKFLFTLELQNEEAWAGKADPKQLSELKLDPPVASLRFVLDREERVFHFGVVGGSGDSVIMKKSWQDELYWVEAHVLQILKLLELNYRKSKMWSIDEGRILGFWWQDDTVDPPKMWQVMREGSGKPWQYADQNSKRLNREVEDQRAADLLVRAKFIAAKKFIGKDPDAQQRLHLDKSPAYRLWIITGSGDNDRKVLYISENSGKRQAPYHFARFEDEPVVFLIEPELVDLLLEGIHVRPKLDRQPDHDDHQ